MEYVDLPAFYLGVTEEMQKSAFLKGADLAPMPSNENILPNITSQARWKYVRTKDGLKLSDGNVVYGFHGLPENYPVDDTRISRTEHDNVFDFDKDAVSRGTAQIHRASPDNIYMTLADGQHNPTFMLQHEAGKQWRYSPSKKFIEKLKASRPPQAVNESQPSVAVEKEAPISDAMLLDPAAILDAAKDTAQKVAFHNPYTGTGHGMNQGELADKLVGLAHGAQDAVAFGANHPITTFLGTAGAVKLWQMLRDKMNPARVEERKMDPNARRAHELWPVTLGAAPVMGSMVATAPTYE